MNRSQSLLRYFSLTLVLMLGQAAMGWSLGKPDWAKPYLTLPSPAGGYIAKNDEWCVVYGEVEYALVGNNRIEERTRLILENLTANEQTFVTTLRYDDSRYELSYLALNVERTLWHEINLNRKAVKASQTGGAQLVIAGAEGIEGHKRVVFEYTLADRLGFTPWDNAFFFREHPVAKIRYSVEPASSKAGLRMELMLPDGDNLPASFVQAEDGSLTVSEIPAASRISPRNLAFQPSDSDLYPWVLITTSEERDKSFTWFAKKYRKAWDERSATIDKKQVEARAASLVQGLTLPVEKASRLASFVQNDVQYDDSNESSIDSWLPLAAQEVLRSMKGDCKGKVMLLQALLDTVGIRSAPVLLRNSSSYHQWRSHIGTTFINHVILAVDLGSAGQNLPATIMEGPAKGWVIIDPTVTTTAFGQPMPGLEGVSALLCGDGDTPQFVLHTKSPSANVTRVEAQCTVDELGQIRTKLKAQDNGDSNLMSNLTETFSPDDMRRELQKSFSQLGNQVRIEKYAFRRPKESESKNAELDVEFVVAQGMQVMNSSNLLDSPFVAPAYICGIPRGLRPGNPGKPEDAVTLTPPWDAKRNTAGRAWTLDATVTVSLPEALTWTPPAARHESYPWMQYDLVWATEGNRGFRGTLHIQVPRGTWPVADRKARLKLVDELFSGLYSPLVLGKKTQ